MGKMRVRKTRDAKVVDLFCGVGGLTHGMQLEGLNVVAGVDNDKSCKYAFQKNNDSKFIHKDIEDFGSKELDELFKKANYKILVGCAPCQPFSSMNRTKTTEEQRRERWAPIYRFMDLITETSPDIVSMENVPELMKTEKYPVFETFVRLLKNKGYHVFYGVVKTIDYGVPQNRRRLVLLASKHGEIRLIPPTHKEGSYETVKKTIAHLPKINDGEVCASDPLHRSSKLSETNLSRIKATPKDGGSAKSWNDELMPDCYKKDSGKSYMTTVYGRMRWNDPSPTMTTHCTTLGAGRYGHPEQDRAISLREAALLQSFPEYYEFEEPEKISMVKTARHIGNAVPVGLGRAIAKSIKTHLKEIKKLDSSLKK